jgi:hypothetical protein
MKLRCRKRHFAHLDFEISSTETTMLVDTHPARLELWLGRLARLDANPALPGREPSAPPAAPRTAMRPAVDLEIRLMLRDRGWNP